MRLQHDLMSFVICRLRVFNRLCPNTSKRRRVVMKATNIGTLYLKFYRELIIELVPKTWSFSQDRCVVHAN